MLIWKVVIVIIVLVVGIWIGSASHALTRKFTGELSEDRSFHGLVESWKDKLYYLELVPTPRFLYASPPLENWLGQGHNARELSPVQLCEALLHPEDLERVLGFLKNEPDFNKPLLYRMRNEQGEYHWYEEYITPIYQNGQLHAIQGILRNIQDRFLQQQAIEHRMCHDAMTGLHNREHYEELVKHYDREEDMEIALVLCDMDSLKKVNDTFGHLMGDKYIREAAKLLKPFASEKVIISRIGGDEFSILIKQGTRADANALVTSLREAILRYPSQETGFSMSMSIGVAAIDHSIGHMIELFAMADQEMYLSKLAKKGIS